jgi:hypothetical protein
VGFRCSGQAPRLVCSGQFFSGFEPVLSDPQADAFDIASLLKRLDESLNVLEWAVNLVPNGWSHRSPYGRISREEGAWSVAMNLAHLALYEERLPTTVLESLVAGGDGVGDTWFREPSPYEDDAVDLAAAPLSEIMERLRRAHSNEWELARRFGTSTWTKPSTGAWASSGIGPPAWSPARVLAKSLQHTWEHGNSILKVALFAPRDLAQG